MIRLESFKELAAELRRGPFTSVGSYPKFYVTADGGTLSHAAVMGNALQVGRAMRRQDDPQWDVRWADVNWENPALYCDETGERIESAYAEQCED